MIKKNNLVAQLTHGKNPDVQSAKYFCLFNPPRHISFQEIGTQEPRRIALSHLFLAVGQEIFLHSKPPPLSMCITHQERYFQWPDFFIPNLGKL